jgi:hypothetical protein
MRLLADENVPLKAVQLLREKGHDVLSISESMPQATITIGRMIIIC